MFRSERPSEHRTLNTRFPNTEQCSGPEVFRRTFRSEHWSEHRTLNTCFPNTCFPNTCFPILDGRDDRHDGRELPQRGGWSALRSTQRAGVAGGRAPIYLARRNIQFLIFMFAIPTFSRIFHTSGQNVRKIAPRRPFELSRGPVGAFSQRRFSRHNERVRHVDV